MITSWAVCVYAMYRAQWSQSEVVIQTSKEEKARRLVEYSAILYRNQPEWLRKRHPLKRDATALAMAWADGGRLYGIPSAEDQIRMFHPTIVIFDEAAFLPGFEACYDTAEPVAKQIIADFICRAWIVCRRVHSMTVNSRAFSTLVGRLERDTALAGRELSRGTKGQKLCDGDRDFLRWFRKVFVFSGPLPRLSRPSSMHSGGEGCQDRGTQRTKETSQEDR
jgi:hypothetical protein